MQCLDCFFNRPGAYYVPISELPLILDPEEVGDGIVRMNCGHDSNIEREKVIEAAARYKHAFFNTSIPKLDFPGPVVLTANPSEERRAHLLATPPKNLMYVRLRTSATNLHLIDEAVRHYADDWYTPVVITFMAYYTERPKVNENEVNEFGANLTAEQCYEWKVRHINSYWCATTAFMRVVMDRYLDNRLVTMCGSIESGYCRDCCNCGTYYLQTQKRLRGE